MSPLVVTSTKVKKKMSENLVVIVFFIATLLKNSNMTWFISGIRIYLYHIKTYHSCTYYLVSLVTIYGNIIHTRNIDIHNMSDVIIWSKFTCEAGLDKHFHYYAVMKNITKFFDIFFSPFVLPISWMFASHTVSPL